MQPGTVNGWILVPYLFTLPVFMQMGGSGLLLAEPGLGWKVSAIGGWFRRSGALKEGVQSSLSLRLDARAHANKPQFN